MVCSCDYCRCSMLCFKRLGLLNDYNSTYLHRVSGVDSAVSPASRPPRWLFVANDVLLVTIRPLSEGDWNQTTILHMKHYEIK